MIEKIALLMNKLFNNKNVMNVFLLCYPFYMSMCYHPFLNFVPYISIPLYYVGLNSLQDLIKYSIPSNEKLYESVNSFIYYSFDTILIHSVLLNTTWFSTLDLFDNIDNHRFSSGEILVYHIQIAHYILELYNILYKSVKRKDDKQMLAHHIITLTLIIASYYTNLIRAGLYVMYLHDINDIFLQLSKTLVYLNYTEKVTDVTFGTFIISWIYTRLYKYVYIIHQMFMCYNTSYTINLIFYNTLLLYGLNIYWFILIMKVLVNKLVYNKLEDIRE
jgi:very-long-chain ceramide synthase